MSTGTNPTIAEMVETLDYLLAAFETGITQRDRKTTASLRDIRATLSSLSPLIEAARNLVALFPPPIGSDSPVAKLRAALDALSTFHAPASMSAWEKLHSMLDNPPPPNESLRQLLTTAAPWDEDRSNRVANVICEAGAPWISEPLPVEAYDAMAKAAEREMRASVPAPASPWQPIEIDLSKGEKHEHPDFNTIDYFIAEIGSVLYFGRMQRVWFGWHFACGFGASGGIQFDTPGWNSSRWKRVWRLPAPPSTSDGGE